jgi:riboflavin biosynthesis pyrimidine reductase
MPDDAAAVRFTVLEPVEGSAGPIDSLDDGRLTDFYAYPEDLQSCWVRGNMIASLDGGATDDGKAGGLAGPGDRAVFALMRQLADVILVGAGTVRIENYSGAQFSPAQRQARARRGQAEVPPIAVVTNRGVFDHDAKLFTRTEVPPLILTCAEAAEDTRTRLGSVAEVIDASGPQSDRVDAARALEILADRKLYRVLTEGGPQFLDALITDGLLDELCLTIAPLLVGGVAPRITTGGGEVHTAMRLSHLLSDDAGYLYARYLQRR